VSLRTRLAIGYATLFLLALVVLGAALFLTLRAQLLDDVDMALRDRAGQVERAIVADGSEQLDPAALDADIFVLSSSSQELSAPGIHIRVLDTSGQPLAVSSEVAGQLPVDVVALERAGRGQPTVETIRVNGQRVRVMYRPLRFGDQVGAVIQLAGSLRPMERTLEDIQRLLLGGGLIALGGGLLGGWWLTRLALRPVTALTATVARIAATGELSERLPEPATQTPDEIGRLALTFNELVERLQLMVDRQRALVADTSHELRNPLMVVRGNLELLAHDLPTEERREATQDAIGELDRMTRLIQDLLFLADADAHAAIEHDDVPLEAIVAAVTEDARRIALREDGAREVVLEANDPLVVRGDAERLRQLVWNLVENAVRYTPAGGTITIALRRRGAVAELTVADTGIGIPPEHLPHIFERFYRVDTSRSRALGGTGLGLSIVRQIAGAHGGQVRVRSTPNAGSTFTVALPVVSDE
jgi:heavy metal sensor kinase